MGKKKLNQLFDSGKPFYYQFGRPDLGAGHRGSVLVCRGTREFASILKWLSGGTLVWAEPAPDLPNSTEANIAPKPRAKPVAEHDYSFLPGEPTDDTELVRNTFRQGVFKYQFYNSPDRRSRVMRCTDEAELAFIIRQMCTGATVYLELIDKPSG